MDGVSPGCTVDYSCASVVRNDGQSHNFTCEKFLKSDQVADGLTTYLITNWEDYMEQKIPPGEYTLTLAGESVDGEGSHTVEVPLVFEDICGPPEIFVQSELADTVITVVAGGSSYLIFDDYFKIVPSDCPFETSLSTDTTLPDEGYSLLSGLFDDGILILNFNEGPDPGDYNFILNGDSRSPYIND